jgi:hypothetical protein
VRTGGVFFLSAEIELNTGRQRAGTVSPYVLLLLLFFERNPRACIRHGVGQDYIVLDSVQVETLLETGKGRVRLQVRLLMEMLNCPPWSYYPLTLQILSSEYLPLRAKCPDPPSHMAVNVVPLEVPPQPPQTPPVIALPNGSKSKLARSHINALTFV